MRLFAALVLALSAVASWAQTAPASSSSLRGEAGIGAVFQQYTVGDNAAIQQQSIPLSASVRHASGFGVSAYGVYASVSSDELEPLSGLGDVQLGASYLRRMGGAAVEASLGANLPTGMGTLSEAAFSTATTLAFDDFAFATPTLGQGASVSPALMVALPAGPNASIGFGASFAAHSAYSPFEDDTSSYTPASETTLTAGLDTRAGPVSFALDVTMVQYGSDTFRGTSFDPGNKLAASARWTVGRGAVRGRLQARYRQVFDGIVGVDDRPVAYLRPSQALVALGIQIVTPTAGVDLSTGLRYYGAIEEIDVSTSGFGDHQLLLDLGIAPAVSVSPSARIRGAFTYTMGLAERIEEANAPTFTGFRAAVGLELAW